MGPKLTDRHWYAMGVEARHTGEWSDAYRPSDPLDPLAATSRYLRLPVRFIPARGGEKSTNLFGDPLWHGTFDASYTRPGDYIVGPFGVFFIASQVPLLPVLCVKTNRTISIARPSAQTATSINPYGGYALGNSIPVLSAWPASVTLANHYAQSEAALPSDEPVAYLAILMPGVAKVTLNTGDIVSDDLDRSGILVASEETDLGWRLVAKVATS